MNNNNNSNNNNDIHLKLCRYRHRWYTRTKQPNGYYELLTQ